MSPTPPASSEEVQARIAEAAQAQRPLEVVGTGTRRGYGRPVRAEETLSLAGLNGVVDYQPRELILVVRPGTPLADVETLLAGEGQMLAFEPPHSAGRGGGTIGGVVACNLSGPRRIRVGAARDHLLGFQAVTGRGEVVRGGGRVVKNVTGYDLSKLMCGSFGTLAVLTEVCVKVLPRPEAERTVAVPGLGPEQALEWLIQAAGSSHDAGALAHLPPGLALPGAAGDLARQGVTLVRLEGPGPSVAYRGEQLAAGAPGPATLLEGETSRRVWRAIADGEPVVPESGERLWRLSLPATAGADVLARVRALGAQRAFLDWGGALVWCVLPNHVPAERLHATAREAGGHARLAGGEPVAPDEAAFTPPTAGVYRLNRNLKEAFDPARILNPGRVYADL